MDYYDAIAAVVILMAAGTYLAIVMAELSYILVRPYNSKSIIVRDQKAYRGVTVEQTRGCGKTAVKVLLVVVLVLILACLVSTAMRDTSSSVSTSGYEEYFDPRDEDPMGIVILCVIILVLSGWGLGSFWLYEYVCSRRKKSKYDEKIKNDLLLAEYDGWEKKWERAFHDGTFDIRL